MRNLKLHRLVACELPVVKNSPYFAIDPDIEGPKLYFYYSATVYKFCQRRNLVEQEWSLKHLYPVDVPSLVGLAYVCLMDSLYLTFENGDIVGMENGKFKVIGDVASGLSAMEWSPDEELVVLVTREDKAIIMSQTFDTIVEVDIHQNNFGEKSFVNVGWGKKETQFHGSEGKAAAKAPSNSLSTPVFDWDDLEPRIRWRGDGLLFAISSVHPQLDTRQIHIFNREGCLQYTSETIPGLEQALDWKPSGSMIASTQRLPNKHIVAFFEKNGLRHGEIVLPFGPNQVEVREVKWNSGSTILAVWCVGIEENLCCLQLWACTNYHWHLKQILNFSYGQRLTMFAWDMDKPTTLHILREDGKCFEYQWKWSVDHSLASSTQDVASVAVIDGVQVKMTNFSESVTPPPMCSYTLQLGKPVTAVVFIAPVSNENSNQLAVIMDSSIAIFSNTPGLIEMIKDLKVTVPEYGNDFVERGTKLVPQGLYQLEWSSEELRSQCGCCTTLGLHHWLWLKPTLFFCVAAVTGFKSRVLSIRLTETAALVSDEFPAVEPVLGLSFIPGSSGIAIFTEANYWQCVDPDRTAKLQLLRAQSGVFDCAPARCQQYSVLDIEGETVVIGLTSLGQLFVNNKMTLKTCTSYFVHPEFLLLTTHQNFLLCIPRNKMSFDALTQQGASGSIGTERQIERGSRLIVAAPQIARVVLQMPRGNLEAVQPRSLALHIIKKLLDEMKYGESFDLMRRQRINLNIFYDHNPEDFLSNLKEFVLQVKNPTWICLFISDLMEADVTETMYAGYYNRSVCTTRTKTKKLDIVCQLMRQVLSDVDREGMLLPIITTYIKQSSPDIGQALKCIKDAKAEEQQGVKLSVSSDEALNYLFYIVDVYELFDVALGLYDFDLVMMVAAKSQKDPKEYIPFLNELRKLEPNYQRFSIDKHLKKYNSALIHLSKCGESHGEECLNFMKTHQLYVAALNIFPRSHSLYEPVCESYAEYLLTEKKYEEAGLMFSRSNCHGQAIDAYKKAGSWKTVLTLVPTLQLSDDDLSSFYKELAHDLREHKQYLEAAIVFGEYLHDAEERVVSLCMARAWDEALRIISLHNLPALKDFLIRPGVVEHFESWTIQLTRWQEQLHMQTLRLKKVRDEKVRRLLEEGDESLAHPECDMFSDTSSVQGSSRSSSASSRGTGKTYRSSKNKRKHERKLLSLKEGSPFEDLALVRALHELYTKAHQLRGELHSLCLTLAHFCMDDRAAELQNKLTVLLTDMDIQQSEIWIPELAQNRAAALKHMGPDSTSNSLAAMGQSIPSALTAAAELEPHLCLPPTLARTSWTLSYLA